MHALDAVERDLARALARQLEIHAIRQTYPKRRKIEGGPTWDADSAGR